MWFAKARQDLKTAKHLHPIEADFYSGIVFHCQQCAEKAIKGFLTFHNVRVLKTHDMDKLLSFTVGIDPEISVKFSKIRVFTKYAVEYRYPDAEMNLPSLDDLAVTDALKIAEDILNYLSDSIPAGEL